MNSPIYKAMNPDSAGTGNPMMNMITQFNQFRNQMQGKNPQEEINRLLQSGQINQQQLNQAQQMAIQMQGMFKGFMK